MRRAVKKSSREAKKQQKGLQDEATRVYTSFAPVRGQILDPVRDVLPSTLEGEILSTLTIIGINIAPSKNVGTSPYFTNTFD